MVKSTETDSGEISLGSKWNAVRLSGRVKFRRNSSTKRNGDLFVNNTREYIQPGYEYHQPSNFKKTLPGFRNQFHNYCQHTSLHGFRYITEERRSLSERIFWICWCLFGISSALYMMSKIWQKWQENPVLTSIATTNLPVSEINFPAITICPVNKAITEKLIIQGCRFNKTFSVMRKIISGLVDVESKNNDNDPRISNSIHPLVAMRYLRLISPKCDDYILRCELNGQRPPCKELFKLVLTDSGYCCSFNAMDADSRIVIDSKNNSEILQQEKEFEYLQKAVWQYHDQYQEKHGTPELDNSTKLPQDSLTCARNYDDYLFPGICRHIAKCRANPTSCRLNDSSVRMDSTTATPSEFDDDNSSSSNNMSGKNHTVIFRAPGAGRSRGLTIMTDTLRCDDVPTDSFKGLRVLVHAQDEFPAVGEKGFIVGPGKETQVGISATDAYSADALMLFKPENRECYFGNEVKLEYYKEYSRSSCVIECETQYILQECGCVPYFSPAAGNHSICGMKKMLECVLPAIDDIQRRKNDNGFSGKDKSSKGRGKLMFNFHTVKEQDRSNICTDQCQARCNETFYNVVISSATFPNQNNPNRTKLLKEAIEDGFENLADMNYVSGSISVLRLFFRESTILQYKRDELFTWEDFISNLGGVMSLCLGFSLLSLIEVIYFFIIRQIYDKKRRQSNKINDHIHRLIIPTITGSEFGKARLFSPEVDTA